MLMRAIVAVLVVAAGVAGVWLWQSRQPDDALWRAYKSRFIMPEGRVIDTGNRSVSHTEGQGYAMLFAVAFDDRETFDRVWNWTRTTLRRPDGLFAWKYDPNSEQPVADPNNATDGDLALCWALLQSAEKWKRPEDRDAALNIAAALRAVVVRDGQDAFLMPGIQGFTGEGKRVVNLSYWVYPALADIAAATNDSLWRDVIATGLRLTERARFGTHGLPPDWLETAGDLRPADGFPPRFGYDAIRIPLYLMWAGHGDAVHIGNMAKYWDTLSSQPALPAWVDVTTGEIATDRMSPGMTAVARFTQASARGAKPETVAPKPEDKDYYSMSLLLLVSLAERGYGRP